MENKFTYWILIGILIVALFGSMYQCKQNANEVISTTKALTDEVKHFKNKLGSQTASKMVLETSNSNLKNIILKKDDTLKKLTDEFAKVKSIVKIKTEIKIDSVPVPFEIKIPCVFEKNGNYLTKDFKMDWNINQDGFDLKNIKVPNEITLVTGTKRRWFLGRQTLTTDVTHSNPLIVTTGIQTIEVKIPKKIYDTRVFNLSVGFIGCMLLSK